MIILPKTCRGALLLFGLAEEIAIGRMRWPADIGVTPNMRRRNRYQRRRPFLGGNVETIAQDPVSGTGFLDASDDLGCGRAFRTRAIPAERTSQ
jgi:hypothetical protein